MSDAIEVRDATPGDAATIVEFQLRMALESEGLTLDRPTLEAGVGAVFTDPNKGRYLIATRREGEHTTVVGCLLTLPEWSDWRNGRVLWIHSVYVVPEARGAGVYRRMYRHLQAEVEAS
ncbi:MAG: GNAT family N-acetyltransferase, partial [Acidobacteriota bacterium]